jgi:adenylyl-sulfate kinase
MKYSFHTQRAFTIWFTGLSGSGKSALATALATHLDNLSLPHDLLDGDTLRQELCADLGFSAHDRNENVSRMAYVAGTLNRHGIIAIVAAISPYRAAREKARQKCGRFIEVHVDCSLDSLIRRDIKGLYQKALAGDLLHFTGISDPYEPPVNPEIYLNSDLLSETESFDLLLSRLHELQALPRPHIPIIPTTHTLASQP